MTQDELNTEQTATKDEYGSRRVTKPIVFLAICLSALGAFLGWASASRKGFSEPGEVIGSLIAVVLFGLFVVALLQLLKRFRNQYSRWKIYCWATFLINLGSVSSCYQELKPALSY